MKLLRKGLLGVLLALGLVHGAQAQTLLPNAEQTFVDANGQPLAGGTACFYVPSTLTAKLTWQDPGQTIPNTSPCVALDSAGRALIYGVGSYRQRVLDVFGNLQWDQLTNGAGAATTAQNICAGTGTVDAITCTTATTISLADQTVIWVVSTGPNTLTNPTVSPNGLTAHTITKGGGNPLVAGDTGAAGFVLLMEYNLANTRWELLNPAFPAAGTSGTGVVARTTNPVFVTPTLGIATASSLAVTTNNPPVVGIYQSAANQLAFSLNSTLAYRMLQNNFQFVLTAANATSYTLASWAGGVVTAGGITVQHTTGVAGATTILTFSQHGGTIQVMGDDGAGNRFMDLVATDFFANSVNVVNALTTSGTPQARTYSKVGSTFTVQLAMAANTYVVSAQALEIGAP